MYRLPPLEALWRRKKVGNSCHFRLLQISWMDHLQSEKPLCFSHVLFSLFCRARKFTCNFSKGVHFFYGVFTVIVWASVYRNLFFSTLKFHFFKNMLSQWKIRRPFFPASHEILIDTSQLHFNSIVVTDREEQSCKVFSRYDKKDRIRSLRVNVKNCRAGLDIACKWGNIELSEMVRKDR